eukprot:TRINITY_DN4867_c0_g1_i2.p1 TRINITY_DN4867_c0_g1~~TRINITY_DN4867_c0_g1_i2.p1  ORF type:complete len:106 (+),score=25.33 TRINITY_DN4867_c0_g1_i2:37-354(+)
MQSLFKHTTALFRNCSQQTTRLTATVEMNKIQVMNKYKLKSKGAVKKRWRLQGSGNIKTWPSNKKGNSSVYRITGLPNNHQLLKPLMQTRAGATPAERASKHEEL